MKIQPSKIEDKLLNFYFTLIVNLDAATVIAWSMIILSITISFDPYNTILIFMENQAGISHEVWQYAFLGCGLVILAGNLKSGVLSAILCFPFASFFWLLLLRSLFLAPFASFSTGILLVFLSISTLFFARSPVYRKLREQNVLLNLRVRELESKLTSIPEDNNASNHR